MRVTLRWYCLRNRHATTMDIATWAREYFGKSLTLHQEMHLEIGSEFSGTWEPECHLWSTERRWKRVSWSHESIFQLVFGKNGRRILRTKDEKDHPDCTFRSNKKQPPWWYGGASVPAVWVICTYVKVPLMQKLMLEFWREICCRQDDNFSQVLHVYFSRTMPGLIVYKFQQHGFIGIECMCLTGLHSRSVSYWKMHAASWRGESHNGDHGLLSSSCPVCRKNGKKFHLQNGNNWYLQFPNDYKV